MEDEDLDLLDYLLANDPYGLLKDLEPAPPLHFDRPEDDPRILRHVRPVAERRAAQRRSPAEIGIWRPSPDADSWRSLFAAAHDGLRSGRLRMQLQIREKEIKPSSFLVYKGILCYVACELPERGEPGNPRYKVVSESGMEADDLRASIARGLRRTRKWGSGVIVPAAED